MKKLLLGLFFILACQTACTKGEPLDLADPYVLEYEGIFYAYGTHARDGITVYRSKDLKHWEGPCGNAENNLALHKNDSWGKRKFWAPEVYPYGDGFIMTFSVDTHTAIAYSDSPLGPFKQEEPFSVYIPDFDNIDSHIFIDDDGQAYLYWVWWRFGRGNEIWVSKLSPDLKTMVGKPHACLHATDGTWEVVPLDNGEIHRVAEGPFILKHNGKYYLTYSCNHYISHDYAVGYAVSDSPLGPWERYEGNPILRKHKGYVGTGHHSFLTTSKGDTYIIYHVHHSTDKVSPRRMLISPYKFKKNPNGGDDILYISNKIIVPEIVETGTIKF